MTYQSIIIDRTQGQHQTASAADRGAALLDMTQVRVFDSNNVMRLRLRVPDRQSEDESRCPRSASEVL